MPLTPEQVNECANKWLHAIEDFVRSKNGDEYATFVGEAFLEAVNQYDAARGDLRKFMFEKTRLIAIDLYRKMYGRNGTKRGSTVRLSEDFDVKDTRENAPANERESLVVVLRTINKTRHLHRWLILGRVLGEFNNGDLTRMLNVSERHLCREAAQVRELLHAD